jgi:hypothetical protein
VQPKSRRLLRGVFGVSRTSRVGASTRGG